MVNPFKASGQAVKEMFTAVKASDCAPGPAVVGAIFATPIVVSVIFVASFFQSKKDPWDSL